MNKFLQLICLLLQVQAVGAIPELLEAWILRDTSKHECHSLIYINSINTLTTKLA